MYKKNYPKIITKYSFLTSPLTSISYMYVYRIIVYYRTDNDHIADLASVSLFAYRLILFMLNVALGISFTIIFKDLTLWTNI